MEEIGTDLKKIEKEIADMLAEITADEFRSFLLFENNHRWSGRYRQGA